MSRKKRKPLTKKQSERIHFKRRLYQRFGLKISRNDYRQIIKQIKLNDKAVYLNSRTSRHNIKFKGYNFDVIYDRKRKEVITVLYTEEINETNSKY